MTTLNLLTIGEAARICGVMPDEVRAKATEAGVIPHTRINGREYFREEDIRRVSLLLTNRIRTTV